MVKRCEPPVRQSLRRGMITEDLAGVHEGISGYPMNLEHRFAPSKRSLFLTACAVCRLSPELLGGGTPESAVISLLVQGKPRQETSSQPQARQRASSYANGEQAVME